MFHPSAHHVLFQSLEEDLDIAPAYTDMYPIVFNLMLWGGIAYTLVIFAIAYGIWVMDPGKDSIIYRMTSTRKKDA
jgi:renin receptor